MTTLHFNPLVPPFDMGEGTAVEELEKANILTYSADSTGVEASDKALKEALEESTIVYFPKGTYLFNEEHKISGKVVIYGDGPDLTTLKTNQTTNCTILSFTSLGAKVHNLKLEGPLSSAVTGGSLLAFSEASSGSDVTTEARNIATYGGYNHITLIECVGITIKDWSASEVRHIGLNIEGKRPEHQTNLVFLLDANITGKQASPEVVGSTAIRAVAGEALTFAHVNTEFFEVGMELTSATENSWFTDIFLDNTYGTGLIVRECKGCNFDKIWSNSLGVGGGFVVGPWEHENENCNFTNCWFFNNSGERAASSGIWKEISETEYKALASKKATWVAKKAYAAKDGVERKMEEGEYPITGGGVRYYEALKATKVLNPRLTAGERGFFVGYTYQTLKATYALKDAVEEESKFYENILAITEEKEATAARKPKGAEGATYWKEITEAEWLESDHPPVSPANGITVGPGTHESTIADTGIRLAQNNAIHLERAPVESEQNTSIIGCQLNEYKGFGIRIGAKQGSPLVMGNALISLGGRGSIANDTTAGFVVFNTGANEFLTGVMSKPAEQVGLVEGVLRNEAVTGNLRVHIMPYKTKAESESKAKHKLNSTAIQSVTAYKYPAGKFESKMQLATKTVESYTVNSASEVTIKWSSALAAKEEIAIVITAY